MSLWIDVSKCVLFDKEKNCYYTTVTDTAKGSVIANLKMDRWFIF